MKVLEEKAKAMIQREAHKCLWPDELIIKKDYDALVNKVVADGRLGKIVSRKVDKWLNSHKISFPELLEMDSDVKVASL